MTDFAKIKSNVELMASKGAPPEHINDYLYSEGYSPSKFKSRVEGMNDARSLDKAIRYSAGSGLAGFLDSIPNGLVALENLRRMETGVVRHSLGAPVSSMPETIEPDKLSGWKKLFEKAGIINDAYAPTTGAEKVADFTTQALTGGGINPAAITRNAARGLVAPIVRDVAATTAGGIGAGLGNVLTENVNTGNESLDKAVKIAATLGGGTLSGAPFAMRGTGGDRAAAATKGFTAEESALADALVKKAAAAGAPVTAYEAYQAVRGLNPKMQTQQRIVEQSDDAAKLTSIMQKRPKANADLFEKAVSAISGNENMPDALGGTLQRAAKEAIETQRNVGNKAAETFYANSANNPAVKIPSHEWNALASDPAIAAALQTVKKNPFGGLQNASDGSVQWLDAAKKWLDSQSKVVGANRYEAGNQSAAARRIVEAVDPVSPDYAKARAIVAENMRNKVIPMEDGQIGKLAASDDIRQQSSNLLPNDAAGVSPDVIKKTAQAINAENPDIFPRFLAYDLRRKFNEKNQGERNPMGGYEFKKLVSDNPVQEQNLIAAIKASGANSNPVEDALSIFRAQGYKPPVNSATTANASEIAAMTGSTPTGSNPVKWAWQVVPRTVDKWRNGMATKELADALSAGPESVQRIEELARINGMHDPMKQQMLINLLLSNKAE